MKAITDFKLSCCKLFDSFPLYHYRTESEGTTQKLNVLLMGYGSRMETILHEILTNGQLLDTDLSVTVVSPAAPGMCRSLQEKAPYLGHFVGIYLNYQPLSTPDESDRIAALHFDEARLTPENVPDLLLERCECNYIIISTGSDEKNLALAKACTEFIADQKTLIAYVQKRAAVEEIEVISPLTTLHPFGTEKEALYRKQLEQIAFNLHFVYEKSQNERARIPQILERFYEPYNYVSNMEAAVHIRSKLACCGIETDDQLEAAQKFHHLMTQQPDLVNQLSVLEHRRWMMEKLLQGYRQLEELNLIYSRRGVRTHSSEERWHCCLVSCDPTGQSRIRPEDWKNADKAGAMTHLDQLDQMSLRIHWKCAQISKTNRPHVLEMLQSIRSALTGHITFSENTLETEKQMELAISQMYQQKKSAIPLYEREWHTLKELISAEGMLQSTMLTEQLCLLNSALEPLIEYISKKDYKKADFHFIEKIPFVLTHKTILSMMKILSEKNADNLFSAWQLEPESMTFLGCAGQMTELEQLRQQADNILRFVKESGLSAQVSWHIIVPEFMGILKKDKKELFRKWDCILHAAPTLQAEHINTVTDEILSNLSVDLIDVSGSDRLLSRAAERSAEQKGIPLVYVRKGQILNLADAVQWEYPAPRKNMTVREMFSLSGAVLQAEEGSKLSDISALYEKFWNIANQTNLWSAFCSCVQEAFKNTPKPTKTYKLNPAETEPSIRFIEVRPDVTAALIPVLNRMQKLGFVLELAISASENDMRCIRFTAPGQKFATFLRASLIELCEKFTSSSYFHLKRNGYMVILTLCDFSVKKMVLPEEHQDSYKKLLAQLGSSQILTNLTWTAAGEYSFNFASADILNAFQLSGRVLEYFLYYSALLEGHFTDVSMGWKFLHSSSSDSAENELDVICTKGTASLFISAKMVQADLLKYQNKLNYFLYEVSLLADRFGINTKPVLAAPALPQFEERDGKRVLSAEVQGALRRGVYLLGQECFSSAQSMGQVLDNIIEGREEWCEFL